MKKLTPSFYLASEFSNKVKASNCIEENILQRKLHLYDKQELSSLQMIERESNRFKVEIKGSKTKLKSQKQLKLEGLHHHHEEEETTKNKKIHHKNIT